MHDALTIKHLFWDFDGTLYDSYPQMLDALLTALAELGIRNPSEAEALSLLKVSVFHAVSHYAALYGISPDTAMQVFRKHNQKPVCYPPYQGLESCLKRLHQAGIRHYLYTHKNHRAIQQLERDNLYQYFVDAVTHEDGFPEKPAPDALLTLMKRNNIAPSQSAMVGDRAIDLGAGHNAGMIGILFDPGNFYPSVDAEMRVQTMDELCEWVLDKGGRWGCRPRPRSGATRP